SLTNLCPPPVPLFPYTTLFRSPQQRVIAGRYREQQTFQAMRPGVLVIGRETERLAMRHIQAPANATVTHPLAQQRQVFHINIKADRKSTRLNSSHVKISYAVFC